MRIYFSNKDVKAFLSNKDGEDELVVVATLPLVYDFNTMTLVIPEKHEAINEFDANALCETYGLIRVETEKSNIFKFTRG